MTSPEGQTPTAEAQLVATMETLDGKFELFCKSLNDQFDALPTLLAEAMAAQQESAEPFASQSVPNGKTELVRLEQAHERRIKEIDLVATKSNNQRTTIIWIYAMGGLLNALLFGGILYANHTAGVVFGSATGLVVISTICVQSFKLVLKSEFIGPEIQDRSTVGLKAETKTSQGQEDPS